VATSDCKRLTSTFPYTMDCPTSHCIPPSNALNSVLLLSHRAVQFFSSFRFQIYLSQ
jgi:hypothetical protein